MKSFGGLAAVALCLFAARAEATQATSQGQEAVKEYRAQLEKKNRVAAQVSPGKAQTESHAQKIKEINKEDERDRAHSEQMKKLPKEQRERLEKDYRAKRAEQNNKRHREALAAENVKGDAR